MAINLADNNPRIAYSVAEGVTQTVFAVPFEFFEDADVNVYVDGVLKAEGTDYTLTGGEGATGTLTFVPADPGETQQVTGIAGGSTVILFRRIAIERTTDFQVGVDIARPALNQQLDILTGIAADHDDRLDRTLYITDKDPATPDLSIENFASFYGRTLLFNASTGKPEAGPNAADVANAQANAVAAAASAAAAASSATDASNSATAASTSASNAASSASAAATSEIDAQVSQTAAALSESNAATSETNAASSASAASTSASNAATSESNASASASAAATSASNAATSESNASTFASNASASASSASTSASNAATSETNAANSATAAAASAAEAESVSLALAIALG